MSKYDDVIGALDLAKTYIEHRLPEENLRPYTKALQTMRDTFGEVDVEMLSEAFYIQNMSTDTDEGMIEMCNAAEDYRNKHGEPHRRIIEKTAALVLEFMEGK